MPPVWSSQKSGTQGLSQLQLVFLELPKYDGARQPESLVDKWAYFFREAESLTAIFKVNGPSRPAKARTSAE